MPQLDMSFGWAASLSGEARCGLGAQEKQQGWTGRTRMDLSRAHRGVNERRGLIPDKLKEMILLSILFHHVRLCIGKV